MKKNTRVSLAVAALSATALLAACGQGANEEEAVPAEAEATATTTTTAEAPAEKTVMVGGAEMYPSKNIVENAVNSKDHTTLVSAVQAAGLAETLSGPGPFTVFAPTNAAFEKLPAGAVDGLLKPESKAALNPGLAGGA